MHFSTLANIVNFFTQKSLGKAPQLERRDRNVHPINFRRSLQRVCPLL